jgi:hypothetical protein
VWERKEASEIPGGYQNIHQLTKREEWSLSENREAIETLALWDNPEQSMLPLTASVAI